MKFIIRHRLLIVLTFLVLVFFLALRWFFSPAHIKQMIIGVLEEKLDKRVNIEDIKINLFSSVKVYNIAISGKTHDAQTPFVQAEEVSIDYNIPSLLKKRIDSITAINAAITSTITKQKPAFKITGLNIKAGDISGKNRVGSLELEIAKARFGTFGIEDIKAGMAYKDGVLNIKQFASKIYRGTSEGKGELKLKQGAMYQAALEIKKMDLREFCADNVSSEYRATGAVDGCVSLSGDKAGLKQLAGEFASIGRGTVNAETFQLLMLNMPEGALRNSVMAIFSTKEDFIYDEGKAKIGLRDDGDVFINLYLKGPKGTFSFDINIENAVIQTFLKGHYI